MDMKHHHSGNPGGARVARVALIDLIVMNE